MSGLANKELCLIGHVCNGDDGSDPSSAFRDLKNRGLEASSFSDPLAKRAWQAAEKLEAGRPGKWGIVDLQEEMDIGGDDLVRLGEAQQAVYPHLVPVYAQDVLSGFYQREEVRVHRELAEALEHGDMGQESRVRKQLEELEKRRRAKGKRSGAQPLPCDCGAALNDTAFSEPDYIIDGVMERNEFWLLYGPAGVGKTFAAQGTALELGMGFAWMGHSDYKTEKGWVLYVNLDMSRRKMLGRFQKLCKQYSRKPSEVPIHFYHHLEELKKAKESAKRGEVGTGEIKANLTAEELEARIEATIEEVGSKPILIVIDTMYRLMLGLDETSFQQMGPVVTTIQRIAYHQATVLALHHTGHGGDYARGHSVLHGVPEVVQGIREVKGSSKNEKCLVIGGGKEDKGRDGFEPFVFKVLFPGGRCIYQHPHKAKQDHTKSDGPGRESGYNPKQILSVFQSVGDRLPRKRFMAALRKGDKPSEDTIDRWLKKAVQDGLLDGNGEKGYTLVTKGAEQWDAMQLEDDVQDGGEASGDE